MAIKHLRTEGKVNMKGNIHKSCHSDKSYRGKSPDLNNLYSKLPFQKEKLKAQRSRGYDLGQAALGVPAGAGAWTR